MEKIVNGKKITAAVVIIDSNGSILGCHGFGKPKDSGYDFPKGCVEEGETDTYAAARELKEEADIYICDFDKPVMWNEFDRLIDCGIHPHNKEKNIHIFLYPVNSFPDLKTLKCTSCFTSKNGKQYPEIDGYRVIHKDERSMFNKVLQNKFDIIDSFNK